MKCYPYIDFYIDWDFVYEQILEAERKTDRAYLEKFISDKFKTMKNVTFIDSFRVDGSQKESYFIFSTESD